MERLAMLKEELFQFPIEYNDEEGFLEESSKILSRYIELVETNKLDSELINSLRCFKKYYEEMFDCYYIGQHSKAFSKFERALESLKIKDSQFIVPIENLELYRARINDNENRWYLSKEMWYIPLNERGKVKTERFSFPGLPCLYLGSSTFSCWLEMNRPSFSELQFALFENLKMTNNVYYLDISILPNKVEDFYKINRFSLEEYLLIWPILAMSSIKVNNKSNSFKPEYVFPQFLMEYISSGDVNGKKIIGIKYASTRAPSKDQYNSGERTYSCFVFPTSTATDRIPNEDVLNKYFDCTNTWSGMSLITGINLFKDEKEKLDYLEELKEKHKEDIYLSDSNSLSYDGTQFVEFEALLGLNSWLKKKEQGC